jgi:hypothetical protein
MNFDHEFWNYSMLYFRYACISYCIPHFSDDLKIENKETHYVNHNSKNIDEIFQYMDWCDENCKADWTFNENGFAFISSTDAALFKLTV